MAGVLQNAHSDWMLHWTKDKILHIGKKEDIGEGFIQQEGKKNSVNPSMDQLLRARLIHFQEGSHTHKKIKFSLLLL